ncbi:MAG: RdgB/HAM1 family non-canonical purine NTP pyrophosphatase [Acidobacteria bacterium]|nr:RdgB/HAM1 family non-canonical purine NTP pyrophosphatase [Acidobacteriota bacterium]
MTAKRRIYCATTNPGKLREFKLGGAVAGWEVEPVPGLADLAAPEETGSTFAENAAIKAIAYSLHAPDGAMVLVDDSGLAVDALEGAPGVWSARYAGPDATDEDNNRLVLERMAGRSDRAARFVCVIALAQAGALLQTFEADVRGELLTAPRGSGGFGYDPLFFYPPFGVTLAEATAEQKLTVSHRGEALLQLFAFLG